VTIEPSQQNWIKYPDAMRIFGTREAMEARIAQAFYGWRHAELNYAPTAAAMLAHHYGTTLAHWGLAIMELDEREAK
jgi:hypothetical protein